MSLLHPFPVCARVCAAVIALPLVGLVACSGDATHPSESAVASVVITGAPATTLLVGDSVRLVATAVNATGSTVANQRVTWKSSEPTVAAVSASGMVIALGAGKATITGSVGSHEGTATLDVADGITLGTQGGTLTAAGGAVMLSVSAGSLAQATLVLVHPAANPPTDARIVPNTAYEIGPEGVSLQRGATLAMKYDPAKLPAGLAGESLQLYVQSGTGWAVVPGSKVNVAATTATGIISRGGVYAVRSTPVDRIVLSGAVAGGALYAGQTGQIAASLFASTGDSLPRRPMTWSSSDPARVVVDSAGKITALAPGAATLTAMADGKSATTTVTVLSRPTPSWSRAADWTTFQGNPRHTGYVDATLDPVGFRERWIATPIAGAAYYPPTTGGGRLYLAMNASFSKQQIVALNPSDGSQQWVRDFGPIFGINQPTYDGGTVYLTSGGHQDTYMWALNEADGSLRFQTPFASQWEHWKAPVVAGSTIVTAGGSYGGMYGFDRATGKQTFFLTGPQVDGWAPAAADGMVYVTGSGLRVVSPTDGKLLATVSDARLASVTTPVLGDANDLLTIDGNRLISVDLAAKKVAWEQSGSYTGMPVVGGGVVYGISGTVVAARRESDGALLWSWTPPSPYRAMQTMVLTNNLLFVSIAGDYSSPGATFAVDLGSHMTVWSYPMSGSLALSNQGMLYIVQGSKVAAISVR